MTSVDDLTWSQLRPQKTVPPCVLNSIPIEDMKSFLHIMATNPTLPFDETSAICTKIQSYRRWRYENANPNLASKPFSILSTLKRNRKDTFVEESPKPENMEIVESTSEDEQRKRKQRRSSRPVVPAETFSEIYGNTTRGLSPKIGIDCQAIVPPAPLPPEYWERNPPKIDSQLIFSVDAVDGDLKLNTYLDKINLAMRRRDGFPLAPFALELALEQFMQSKGKIEVAVKASLARIPTGPYFPGIRSPFTYEEQCAFVRTLTEQKKNFLYMSEHVLKNRSVSELTWMYYTRHKQFWLQNGGLKNGLIQDDGGERHKRVYVSPARVINALKLAAISPGDGFPFDSRVQPMLMECRRGCVAREKRRREEKAGKS